MAYDKGKIFEQAKKAIKKNNLFYQRAPVPLKDFEFQYNR